MSDMNQELDELLSRVSELKKQVQSEVDELNERVSELEKQVPDDD